MSSLYEFLAENIAQHKTRVARPKRLSRGVSQLLLQSKDGQHHYWPYSCTIDQDKLTPQYQTKPTSKRTEVTTEYKPPFSISTQAMICASLDHVLILDRDHNFLGKDTARQLREVQIEVETAVLAELKSRVGQSPMLASTTYGHDDVFTASWLLEMYSRQADWEAKEEHWEIAIKERLVLIISSAILNDKKVIDYERRLFEKDANEAGAHSLPLLKVLSALQVIKADQTLHRLWPSDQESVETSIER
jgi:hypothetical protein